MWSLSWVQCQWSLNARVLCWLCNLSPFIKRILFSINSHAACNSCSLAIHWLKYLSSCYILLIMIQDFKRHVQKTMCMSLTGFIFLTFIEKFAYYNFTTLIQLFFAPLSFGIKTNHFDMKSELRTCIAFRFSFTRYQFQHKQSNKEGYYYFIIHCIKLLYM